MKTTKKHFARMTETPQDPPKKYGKGKHPNSRANMHPIQPGEWRGKAAHERKKALGLPARSKALDKICKRILRKQGSVALTRYLKEQGFSGNLQTVQEQWVARLFESAIKEANPQSGIILATLLSIGYTPQKSGPTPGIPPMKNPTGTELNKGQIRIIKNTKLKRCLKKKKLPL